MSIVRPALLCILLALGCVPAGATDDLSRSGVSLEPRATCRFGPELFQGGLEGRCYEEGPQQFTVRYFAGGAAEPVYTLDWPGEQIDPPILSCAQLCQSGALYLSYNADEMGLAPTTAALAPAGGGCDINKDSRESWVTGDCERGGAFRCHGACGKGCVGCEVEQSNPFCGWMCEGLTLHCYTRPCCKAHDDCLAAATNEHEENACHAQATADGCGWADISGDTNWEADAECLDFEVCVSLFQPEPIDPGEVEPGER